MWPKTKLRVLPLLTVCLATKGLGFGVWGDGDDQPKKVSPKANPLTLHTVALDNFTFAGYYSKGSPATKCFEMWGKW